MTSIAPTIPGVRLVFLPSNLGYWVAYSEVWLLLDYLWSCSRRIWTSQAVKLSSDGKRAGSAKSDRFCFGRPFPQCKILCPGSLHAKWSQCPTARRSNPVHQLAFVYICMVLQGEAAPPPPKGLSHSKWGWGLRGLVSIFSFFLMVSIYLFIYLFFTIFLNIWNLLSNWFPYNSQCSSQKMPFSIPIIHPPLPPTPHQPSVSSQFLSVSYALALSHSNLFIFSFPSPLGSH